MKKPGRFTELPHRPEIKSVSDVLQATQVALDNYDDIFSDFDPSPIKTRILSDDFLNELHRRYAENKKGEFVVNFTLPAEKRSEKTEALIRKRLKDYLRFQLTTKRSEVNEIRKKGIVRVTTGILVLLSLLLIIPSTYTAAGTVLSVLSWYLLWSGFDYMLELPGRLKPEMKFYERFLKARYNFVSEEKLVKYII